MVEAVEEWNYMSSPDDLVMEGRVSDIFGRREDGAVE
jgi:hypothetical protein